MKGIVKKLISTVAAAAVAFTVMTVPGAPGNVAEAAVTENCDGTHPAGEWTAWTSATSLPNSTGNYYLTKDVTISAEYRIDAPNNITLCLNGKTVRQTAEKRIFQIRGGSLTLCDCEGGGTLTGGNAAGTGYDGYGGAVYANMSSGNGFTMYGGTISGNTASQGGGVYVNCAVTINGGTITNNTASGSGGGVMAANNKLTINGEVGISGNTVGETADNVHLGSSYKINIGSNFDTASKIGVSTSTTPTCSRTVDVTETLTKDVSGSFTADRSGQNIRYENNKVQLYADHSFSTTWTTSDTKHWHKCQNCPTITDEADHTGGTATCKEKAVCEICEQEYGELGEHIYGDWSITKKPSETATGTAKRICTKDNSHTDTATVPKLSDDTVWTKDEGQHVDPTETISGKDVYTSETYGTVEVEIPATGKKPTTGGSNSGSSSSGSSNSSKNENKLTEVELGDNAPKTEVTTPDKKLAEAVLTDSEQEAVDDGEDFRIILTVEDGTELAPAADKAAVTAVIGTLPSYELGQYLDVNLLKIIGGKREKITETNAPITVTFEIPKELRGQNRAFAVVRVHDGKTTILSDLDNDKNTVTIKTDKFSTYALIYTENASAGANPATGIALPIIPIAAAITVLIATAKRKSK